MSYNVTRKVMASVSVEIQGIKRIEHSKIYDAKDVIDNNWSLDGLNPIGTITMEVEEE